jgi:hypothetical protein
MEWRHHTWLIWSDCGWGTATLWEHILNFCSRCPQHAEVLVTWPFSQQGPLLWNRLPQSIRTADNLPSFKSLLKTHLFFVCYGNITECKAPLNQIFLSNLWHYISNLIDWLIDWYRPNLLFINGCNYVASAICHIICHIWSSWRWFPSWSRPENLHHAGTIMCFLSTTRSEFLPGIVVSCQALDAVT